MTPRRSEVKESSGRRRGSLSREEILTTAIALAARAGLDALSMPNLAKEMGATPMAIYRYFQNKDELLTAMASRTIEHLSAELPPTEDLAWDEEIIRSMLGLHQALRAFPFYLELCRARPHLLVTRPEIVPFVARPVEALLQVLQRSGISAAEAMRYFAVLTTYTRGFALMQIGGEAEEPESTAAQVAAQAIPQLDSAEFPNLRAATSPEALIADTTESFEAGLRTLVAGIKATIKRSQAVGSRASRPRRPGTGQSRPRR